MAVTIPIPDDRDDLDAWVTPESGWRKPTIQIATDYLTNADDNFALYAVISTWYESDVIEAQVRNCFLHGCDRVYIIDNDSPDDTVAIAKAAGAELGLCYTTDFYMDELRARLIAKFLQPIVEMQAHESLWVMTLDADEFITVPGSIPLRQFLSRLSPHVNTIPANAIDHYPDSKPENIAGFHPAEFQPCAWLRSSPHFCSRFHWKHPLYRYRHGVFDGATSRGFHYWLSQAGTEQVEPVITCYLHHMPFREESFTRKRLTALCTPRPDLGGVHRSVTDDNRLGGEGAIKRWRCLDAVYDKRWRDVELPHAQGYKRKMGVRVEHWSALLEPRDYLPLRWYSAAELDKATREWRRRHRR